MWSTAWSHLRAIRKHGNDSRTNNSNDNDRNDGTEGDDTNDETFKLTVLV